MHRDLKQKAVFQREREMQKNKNNNPAPRIFATIHKTGCKDRLAPGDGKGWLGRLQARLGKWLTVVCLLHNREGRNLDPSTHVTSWASGTHL